VLAMEMVVAIWKFTASAESTRFMITNSPCGAGRELALATVGAGLVSLDHPLFEGGGGSRPPRYSKFAK